ncbi:MAG: hypothetical protein GXO93_04495 [FCB group bacterium]|nr:hypothetical protein [FCB group bacterium]
MSQIDTLKSLETLLESFLERVVKLKERRLTILEGINRLDDITRQSSQGLDITDNIGNWFATRQQWLSEKILKPADVRKINTILKELQKELNISSDSSPAKNKINSEISRWEDKSNQIIQKLTLKRQPEIKNSPDNHNEDTISLFSNTLYRLSGLFEDVSENKKHILTVLNDLLKSAQAQTNKDALILSAFIIYYLKQKGYKVEPYVKKLKEAETLFKPKMFNA